MSSFRAEGSLQCVLRAVTAVRGRGSLTRAWSGRECRFQGKKGPTLSARPQYAQHLPDAEDLHDALQVVGEHVQAHLSAHACKRPCSGSAWRPSTS